MFYSSAFSAEDLPRRRRAQAPSDNLRVGPDMAPEPAAPWASGPSAPESPPPQRDRRAPGHSVDAPAGGYAGQDASQGLSYKERLAAERKAEYNDFLLRQQAGRRGKGGEGGESRAQFEQGERSREALPRAPPPWGGPEVHSQQDDAKRAYKLELEAQIREKEARKQAERLARMAGPPQDSGVRAPPPPPPPRQYGQAESDYYSQYGQGGDAGEEEAAPWASQAAAVPPPMKPDAFAAYQAYLQEANLPVPAQQGMGYGPPPPAVAVAYDPWKLGPPPLQQQQPRDVYPPSYPPPGGFSDAQYAPPAAPAPSFPPPRRSGSPAVRGAGLADLVGTTHAARAHAAQTMDYRRELEVQIAAQKAAKEAQRRQRMEEDAREEVQISEYVNRQGLGPAPPQPPPARVQPVASRREAPVEAPRVGRARVPGASSLAQTQGDDVAFAAAAKRAAAAAHAAELQAQIEARAAARQAAERKAKQEDEAEDARVMADMADYDQPRGPAAGALATAAEEDVSMIAANREFAEGGGVLPSPPRMRAPPPLPPWAMPHPPAPRAAAGEAQPAGQGGAGMLPRASAVRSSVTREEVDRLRAALAARDAALEAAMVAAASAEQRAAAARAGVAMPRGGGADDSLLRAYAAARFGGGGGGMPPMMPYGAAPQMMGYGAPWGQAAPPYAPFYPPPYPGYGAMMPPPFMGPPPPGGEGHLPMDPAMQAEPERSESPEDLFPDSVGRTRTARGGTRRSQPPGGAVDLTGASGSVDLAASLASDSTFVYPLAGREYASTPARTTRTSFAPPPPPPQRLQTPMPEVPAGAQLPLAFGSPSADTMGSPPSAPPLSPVPVPDASPLPLPHAEVPGPRGSSVGGARMSAYGDLDADVDAALERTVDAVEWSDTTASGDLQSTLRRLDAVLPAGGGEVQPEGMFGDRPKTAESRPQSSLGDLPPRRPTTAGAGGGRSKMAGWFKGEQ